MANAGTLSPVNCGISGVATWLPTPPHAVPRRSMRMLLSLWNASSSRILCSEMRPICDAWARVLSALWFRNFMRARRPGETLRTSLRSPSSTRFSGRGEIDGVRSEEEEPAKGPVTEGGVVDATSAEASDDAGGLLIGALIVSRTQRNAGNWPGNTMILYCSGPWVRRGVNAPAQPWVFW